MSKQRKVKTEHTDLDDFSKQYKKRKTQKYNSRKKDKIDLKREFNKYLTRN